MIIDLPKDVSTIINVLERAGYEAYAVGGCVRDTILGRVPQDWDITTSAGPDRIKLLFRKTIDTGIKHGTVTVLLNHTGYEVTTYRIDGEYEDNRHPKSVEFTDNLKLDLERRDFTINAMAYNVSKGLVDEFDGVRDLEAKIIRCVGEPGERFEEDALRMLRAVRFAGQLGFTIEEKTRQAIVERAKNLKNISAERIRTELTKLLVSKNASLLQEAYYTGMTKTFLPELDCMMEIEQKNPHHIFTVGEHTIYSIEVMNFFFGQYSEAFHGSKIPQKAVALAKTFTVSLNEKQHMMLCIAMLLHDVGKPKTMTVDEQGIGHFYGHQKVGEEMAAGILRRLAFDNETIGIVRRLICWHDYRYGTTVKAMRKTLAKAGKDIMPLLFLVQLSDILAQNPETWEEKLERIYIAADLWEQVLESGAALEIKDLKISGRDLLSLGIKQGPEMGRILRELLNHVIERPECNQKEKLLEFVKQNLFYRNFLVSNDDIR